MNVIRRLLGLSGLLIALILGLSASTTACAAPTATQPPATTVAGKPSGKPSGKPIAWVEVSSLPVEARDMLILIDKGGPFKYKKDGTTFRNAEKRLPIKPSSYYREYTVDTPGSKDRGARRIITGKDKEFYYTADHYRSFVRIRR